MMDHKPFRLSKENVARFWGAIEALLAQAIEAGATHHPSDVLEALTRGDADCWVKWTDEGISCAVVTEVLSFPRGLRVRVWLAGAKGGETDWREFDEGLCDYGRQIGASWIDIVGRIGWLKKFPKLEYYASVMSARLDGDSHDQS